MLLSSTANAGTIIKSPAYLGLTRGLVGCWSFDGSYTRVPDCSGNGNTGTITGATRTAGKIGQALNFDGVNDYVTMGDVLDFTSGPFTISVWFKARSWSAGRLISKWSNFSNINYEIYVDNTNDGDLVASLHDGVTWQTSVNSTNDFFDDRWHHAVMVVTITDITLYTDSVASIPDTHDNGIPNNGAALQIGTATALPAYFDGLIDDVRIYNRALSQAEISRLYRIGLGSTVNRTSTSSSWNKGLVGHWTFDGADTHSSGKTDDKSGNGNHGTLTGGPTRAQGKIGQALNFDGVDDYVDAGDPSSGILDFGTSTNFTISTWVKLTKSGFLAGKFKFATTAGYRIDINASNDKLNASIFNASSQNCKITTNANGQPFSFYKDRWTHVVVSFTRNASCTVNDILFYVDGARVIGTQDSANTNMDADISSSQPFRIGAGISSSDTPLNPSTGLIDDVRIWNRALSVSEIRNLYQETQSKFNSSKTGDVLTKGLVGHWTFDGPNISGTRAKDSSGNLNHGTLTGGPTVQQGKIGQALNFDGVDDYVQVRDAGVSIPALAFGTGPFSVSFWMKAGPEDGDLIVSGRRSNGWQFQDRTSSPFLKFYIQDSGGSDQAAATTSPFNNTWHHVVGLRDGTNLLLYIDGILKASATDNARNTDEALLPGLRIGAGGGSSPDSFHGGLVDELRIYNRALSAGEVQKLYNMGR